MDDTFTVSLERARERARAIANSGAGYTKFVQLVREACPWRFEKLPPAVLERDYLRVVDHHLDHLIPRVARYLGPDVRRVVDFGCGSGGSAIALSLVYPDVNCIGTDIDLGEVTIARERAKLYGVADRCEFYCVSPGQSLPFPDGSFDFCQCSSVLEYVLGTDARRFCVHEMARLLRRGGLLFCSVPNRIYPFEIHTRKWGWNYFPRLLHAQTVDCTAWEVKRLARPLRLRLHQTPLIQLLRPWSNFCLRRETNDAADADMS
jgi:ubiquinone/menaquinone biosynthesis C-methylase UbiE